MARTKLRRSARVYPLILRNQESLPETSGSRRGPPSHEGTVQSTCSRMPAITAELPRSCRIRASYAEAALPPKAHLVGQEERPALPAETAANVRASPLPDLNLTSDRFTSANTISTRLRASGTKRPRLGNRRKQHMTYSNYNPLQSKQINVSKGY